MLEQADHIKIRKKGWGEEEREASKPAPLKRNAAFLNEG